MTLERPPRFCGQCGEALPPGQPRFCISCGQPIGQPDDEPPAAAPATGPTVRLANAPGEQSVVGGTVKLPSSGAAPPGLWFAPELPGPDDIVAIYAPLRAVVGGWSGTTDGGWSKLGHVWSGQGSSSLVHFAAEREWFAAAGAAQGARLKVRVAAASHADEGHTRRGFRYRIGADPPMEVADAWWELAGRPRRDLPVPQIQIMAPPRVRRVSDVPERLAVLGAREAETFARQGSVHGLFRLDDDVQQRTPVGRGLVLIEISGLSSLLGLARPSGRRCRVQLHHPLTIERGAWPTLRGRIRDEAAGLGLDMQADAMVEWWLDRQGYDGALFAPGTHQWGGARAAVAFRRSQVALIEG